MKLSDLQTLGRSGLPVSPLALGTMTMGTPRWGSSDEESEAVFNAYVDAGGNFVDTADVYSSGKSEELVGRFVAKRGLRDGVVLATKYGFNFDTCAMGSALGGALLGGNGRKNLHRAVEGSLRRLGTDYIDLYWMHVWDRVTPVEEVLQAMGDLVRAGKIRYFGLSDVPAWYATRMATLAQAHHVPGPIALQLEYSLVERSIEREHVPAAHELGMAVVPWSPLAAGFLTGKYRRDDKGDGRLSGSNPFGDSKFNDRNWAVLDVLREVAEGLGRPPAQVALAWLSARPGVGSAILGARTLEQLDGNLASLDVALSDDILARLNGSSTLDPAFPYPIFTDETMRAAVFGGAQVSGWR